MSKKSLIKKPGKVLFYDMPELTIEDIEDMTFEKRQEEAEQAERSQFDETDADDQNNEDLSTYNDMQN